MNTFQKLESEVRSYCRNFPTVFTEAKGATMTDEEGREYIDFFAGAGALNYGHNPDAPRRALLAYIESCGVTHSLDMFTTAKREFLETFNRLILEPRGLDYRVQFPGPTGTNAVEAALKIARKATGREQIISFTNGFHGMTLGSLSVTGNQSKRDGAGIPLSHTRAMPFDDYIDGVDTIEMLERMLDDPSSGIETPAAFIVETVQAEGGVNVASAEWLRGLARVARRVGAVLIIDDIQVGCGRTGPFFSFERAGITPDVVCLSKSLSGYGFPFAITLIRPGLDVWEPGEHNGTFRGFNPAMVTATAALKTYWSDDNFSTEVERKAAIAAEHLEAIAAEHPSEILEARGLGLIRGLAFRNPELASAASREAFARGVIIETAGPDGEVLKPLPPLSISDAELLKGLDTIRNAVRIAIDNEVATATAAE